MPERADLARWLAHAVRDQVSLTGLSDHAVSEAIYLRDPDRHGIEIYADRPRGQWEGQVGTRMTTLPLDVENLLGELGDPAAAPFDGLSRRDDHGPCPSEGRGDPGHRRLLPRRDRLRADRGAARTGGVPERGGLPPSPRREHMGERWSHPAPAGSASLRHATIVLPDSAELDRVVGRVEAARHELAEADGSPLVRDPSGNALVLATAA